MTNIQEIRNAMIKNAMSNGHNKDFEHNLQLLRIFFKLDVVGHEPRWSYTENTLISSAATPVNPSNKAGL